MTANAQSVVEDHTTQSCQRQKILVAIAIIENGLIQAGNYITVVMRLYTA